MLHVVWDRGMQMDRSLHVELSLDVTQNRALSVVVPEQELAHFFFLLELISTLASPEITTRFGHAMTVCFISSHADGAGVYKLAGNLNGTHAYVLQQHKLVNSISLPLRPKCRNGPPSRSAIKRGWATARSTRFTASPHTPTPQTLTDPRKHWSGGKLRHRRRRGLLPGSDVHGATARRSTASSVTPSSPSRHCNPFVKPRPPLRPRPARWLPTSRSRPTPMVCVPCFPSVTLLVVLGVVDLDLGAHVVYL
jgi:hypothetical protein